MVVQKVRNVIIEYIAVFFFFQNESLLSCSVFSILVNHIAFLLLFSFIEVFLFPKILFIVSEAFFSL